VNGQPAAMRASGTTRSVNSLCHVFGSRPFATCRYDRATNLWPLALLSFGESWHSWATKVPARGDRVR
jgi:fatty-acid desaturase